MAKGRPSASRANESSRPKGIEKKERFPRNTRQKTKELHGLIEEKGKVQQSVNRAEQKMKNVPDAEKRIEKY